MLMLLVAAATTMAQAPTYSVLYNLASHTGDPWYPQWIGLFAQGRDGNLYSTSQAGDLLNGQRYGTVFQLTPAGSVTVLHSFTVGGRPNGGLTLGTDGSLYGTSVQDNGLGGLGYGTVFKITTSGQFTVLHNFNVNTDGLTPLAAPIQGTDGNFYGTTAYGQFAKPGGVYKMTPSGKLTVLYTFSGSAGGLRGPVALILGTDGNFYGTTRGGGQRCNGGCGGIYKITPAGKLTVLHTFNGTTEGYYPVGAIIQASDGNFYGTTLVGGPGSFGVIYKMTPAGKLTVIHDFYENDGLGLSPHAGLVQATDGKFYGAAGSLSTADGVLFQITSTGTYSIVHGFNRTDGREPQVSLFQHTNGTLYGDTSTGGGGTLCPNGAGCGVLYSLSMGLGSFVSFLPPQSSGKVGKTIEFLGQGFNGTTKVSFHGVSATFTVVSGTYLTAVVPAGATTGFVTVATPGRTLTSNKVFRVTPAILSFSPTSGRVGTAVTITGSGLTGATKVTFGGVNAVFTVKSASQITATVPTGAKTGKIAVTTAGGVATSAATFTVTL
jgi:uncharacterized repeat protein (TIGR03803 family)